MMGGGGMGAPGGGMPPSGGPAITGQPQPEVPDMQAM